MEQNELITKLDAISNRIAGSLTELIENVTADQYIAVIEVLFKYHRGCIPRLKHAESMATEEKLKLFLLDMIEEETDHEKLALEDLENLKYIPSEEHSEEVAAYETNWFSITPENQLHYAAMIYVLESIPEKIAEPSIKAIERLQLSEEQTKFIATHLEADVVHSQMALRVCEAYASTSGEDMVEAAEKCADLWYAMLKAPLSNAIPAS